ncbi:Acyl-CoA N-acyltransferase [Penicillium malachiteum]|uniref:Acyl-CoA N-acyltransferase n=1 Tax=Penicillium malachiteum TaxID=1324776 RepID=A0AAD6HUT8_9EURO|nr:Acyl-CoA N-acyltransferase [Penicillium malachiteum]
MVQIYEHDDQAQTLFPILSSHLPYSISLLRRIQHGIAHPTPTAKILATFPSSAPPKTPWLAARVDLFRGRETQIILYSSLEAEHTSIQPIGPPAPAPLTGGPDPCPSSTPSTSDEEKETYSVATLTASPEQLNLVREQLLALLAYTKTNLLPEYLDSLPNRGEKSDEAKNDEAKASNGVPLIPAPDPKAFLIGTMHTGLYTLLLRDGVFPAPSENENEDASILLPGLKVHRFDNPPYFKIFFPRKSFSMKDGEEIPLPEGYRFHDRQGRIGVLDSHLDLVQSRTHIPRSRAQLSIMPGVAIYHDDPEKDTESGDEMPIAWAFLGLDGPVATLHVEPEHRGKGLALSLTKETMRRGMDLNGVFGVKRLEFADEKLGEELGSWVHTEVAQYNKASRRVMQKVGGEILTTVMWTVVELL